MRVQGEGARSKEAWGPANDGVGGLFHRQSFGVFSADPPFPGTPASIGRNLPLTPRYD